MRWAFAYALERILVPLLVALLFIHYFGDAPGGANPYVEQIDRWFGFDALRRGLDHGLSSDGGDERTVTSRDAASSTIADARPLSDASV
jgi:hypothetical protein